MNITKLNSDFLFKIGIPIIFVGIIFVGFVFYNGDIRSESTNLNHRDSKIFEIELKGTGLVFYKITISNYKQNLLFVQILDQNHNILVEQKIQTIMSVNYFNYYVDGNYSIRVTNISEIDTEFNIEYGDVRLKELSFPILITFIGSIIVIYASYKKLKTYSIAQP